MKLKLIKTRVLGIPVEDGQHSRGPVKIFLADADPVEFCIAVPDWLVAPIGLRTRDGHISHPTLEGCVTAYENALRDYSQWLRTSVAKPLLLVYASYKTKYDGSEGYRAAVRNDFGMNSLRPPAISVGYERAFDVNGAIHEDRDGKPGARRHPGSEAITLPYTPELEASILALQASLNNAIRKLGAMLTGDADAVASRLLASAGLLQLTKD